jgi:hypothetical protein
VPTTLSADFTFYGYNERPIREGYKKRPGLHNPLGFIPSSGLKAEGLQSQGSKVSKKGREDLEAASLLCYFELRQSSLPVQKPGERAG